MNLMRGWIGGALLVGGAACSEGPPTPGELAVRQAAVASVPDSATQAADPRSSRSRGSPSAPVTVYEMSDFQCPFCRQHALETMPTLEREYIATGKVRWVFINFPIPELHRNAIPAAELALCAARSEKFWEAHHLLFQHQKTWGPMQDARPFLLSLADSLRLPRAETLDCLQDSTMTAAVREEAQSAVRAGATSTPTFYIEGGLLIGAQPPSVFRGILDSIYAVKRRNPGAATSR